MPVGAPDEDARGQDRPALLRNGQSGTIQDLHGGLPVEVAGTYDLSTRILTRATLLIVMPAGTHVPGTLPGP